ncbi:Kinesin motor domain, partial [Trinorchestia longiramus]
WWVVVGAGGDGQWWAVVVVRGLAETGRGETKMNSWRIQGKRNKDLRVAHTMQVFEEVSQLVQSALDGYNVCVFAYGQTGSGKTYTMEGGEGTHAGIIPRTVDHIFKEISRLADQGWKYTIEVSFLEIYNESIRDLLTASEEAKNLTYDIKLTDPKSPHTHVTNLKTVPCKERKFLSRYQTNTVAHQ